MPTSDLIVYLYIFLFILIVAIIRMFRRKPLLPTHDTRTQKTKPEILIRELFPDLPKYSIIPPGDSRFPIYPMAILAIFGAILGFNLLILPFVPPLSPQINLELSILFWAMILTVGKRFIERLQKPSGIFVLSFWRELGINLFFALMLNLVQIGIGLCGQLNPMTLQQVSPINTLLFMLYIIFVWYCIQVALSYFNTRHLAHANALFDTGNYDQGLVELADLQGKYPSNKSIPLTQGVILVVIGRFDEAQNILHNLLAITLYGPTTTRALTLFYLAEVFVEKKQYDMANQTYELMSKITKGATAPLLGKALVLLLQGIQIQEASKMLAQAYDIRARNIKRDRFTWSLILLYQAWALALMQRPEDNTRIENLMQRTLAETNQKSIGGLSVLHYRIGMIRALRGEKTLAAQHFDQAIQIDPACYAAHQAAEALQRL